MNSDHMDSTTDLDRLLDQLVDDELDESSRRKLLESLDNEPQGWRRCASAFLEAQSWRGGLGSILDWTGEEQRRPEPEVSVEQPPSKEAKGSYSPLGIAALVFLAFGVGWSSQYLLDQGIVLDRPEIAETTMPPGDTSLASTESQAEIQRYQQRLSELENQLKFFDGMSMTPEMIHQLQQQGNRFQLRPRGVIPYRNPQGEQGYMPWGDVEIVPVGDGTY